MNKNRLIVASLVAMLVFAGTAYSQDFAGKDSRNGTAAIIEAVSAIDKGKLDEAMRTLRKVTASDPSNDAAWYYLGICQIYKRNLPEAQKSLKAACDLDSTNYWYRDRLAVAYSMAGEDDFAVATYEKLLKDFPKKNDIYFTLVNYYLKQNRLDKALAAMDQIEAVFGKSESVTSTRYDILLRQNKPQDALKALMAYNEEYSSPRILTHIGDHSMAEYKDSIALACYKEALDLQSNYAPALLGQSEVYRNRRDYADYFKTMGKFVADEETMPQAKAQYLNLLLSRSEPRFVQNFQPQLDSLFDLLIQKHPADSSVLTTSGMYYYATQRSEKAVELIRKNMLLNPENESAAITYIQLLGYMKDWDGILRSCDSAIVRFPGATAFRELKNFAFYNKKDYMGLIRNSEEIIRLADGDTSRTLPALATIGDMHHELGNEKEAFKAYEKVLKVNPGYVPVLNNYAYFLALKGKRLKKAYKMSLKTIEKEPDNPTYLDTIGWILHLQGRDQEAKTHFKHAMIYGGKDSATCLEHYAIVLEALGETDLAKVYRAQAANKKAEGKE